MDSKKKFIKNKYWKKKYKPKNATNTTTTNSSIKKKLPQKNDDSISNQSETSEDEYTLKQPIPTDGWFPESDSESSNDYDNFESVTPSRISISNYSKQNENNQKSDKNWFDKELDNVPSTSESPITVQKNNSTTNNINTKLIENTAINKHEISKPEIQNVTVNKCVKKEENKIITKAIDNEEEELEFLLSLKEAVHTGPLVVNNNPINERRIATSSKNYTAQKPVKAIDLEKWLDSVLDD